MLDLPHTSFESLRRARHRPAVHRRVADGGGPRRHRRRRHPARGRAGRRRAATATSASTRRGSRRRSRWTSRRPTGRPRTPSSTGRATRPSTPRPDERPPLLVMIHGGPTAAAQGTLRLGVQYWTSRGFAVVDVNYRGSTGYGRAYRDLLQGQWGVADVEDCAAVARFLVERGDVDPDRLCIRGGSAGGFTVLAALAFEDVFSVGTSYYGVADLAALGDGHPQVREPLPRRPDRPVAGGAATSTWRARRSTTRRHRPPAVRVPGPRGRGRAAEPVAADRRRGARPRACRSPT